MRRSIYIKLILIFIGIFLLGNSFAFFIVSAANENDMVDIVQTQISQFLLDNKQVYESQKLTADEIEKLQDSSFMRIRFFYSVAEIESEYSLPESLLQTISDVPVIISPKKHKDTLMCIVKSGNVFIAAMPKASGIFVDLRNILIKVIVISLGIGIAVMLIAGWFLVRPIKSLSRATEKIASGDFNVHIAEKRKDEIGKLIRNFNIMAKELNGMELMRLGFVSDISHEFRTPLTSIEGYAKLLRNCKTPEEANEYIDIITEETKRLTTLSGAILLLSKIENENISIQKEYFRLDEQIRKMLLTSENMWRDKNIDLQINMENIDFLGDAQLLYQVWSNLFDNAVKFSDPGGTIEIDLKASEGKVVFTITDFGRGMTGDEQKHMFEKFFTGDKSRNSEGNGLGLSIVKRIVDMHGGRIEVKSNIGEYSEIKVIL